MPSVRPVPSLSGTSQSLRTIGVPIESATTMSTLYAQSLAEATRDGWPYSWESRLCPRSGTVCVLHRESAVVATSRVTVVHAEEDVSGWSRVLVRLPECVVEIAGDVDLVHVRVSAPAMDAARRVGEAILCEPDPGRRPYVE